MLLILALLVAVTPAAANSTEPSLAAFRHDNVRCMCECPTQHKELSWRSKIDISPGSCHRDLASYATSLQGAGQTSCSTCVSSNQLQESIQCSYIAVASSESDCSCGNVLPAPGVVPFSLYSTAECSFCVCTYQLRRQGLVGGVVVFLLVVWGLLMLLIVFNCLPHKLFKLNPYGLSLQTHEIRRRPKIFLQRILPNGVWSWRYLQRSPKDANIGW